ncbi:MAG TPA: hypothetical protein PLJ27_18160 [Polyangiaceae bacterium]|jgi:hypothetical protein|nr:hypothetical protein [Polyangiaceae bacterium]HPB98688.1 hypothetical protein [Polyangiaceae bacterium]HPY20585.1 hypothetical protein [Polyangiaceae bacterium]HQB43071.1 hypothetical protein [Polyangiaceae bacterium]HQK19392.1 hypothetical protein [Polyangiaceae bacterium]
MLIADYMKVGTAIDLWPWRQVACGCPEIIGWMVLDKRNPSSAFGRICARCTLSFETRFPDAKSSKPSRSSSVRLMMYRVAIPNMEHTSGGMESEYAIKSMETEH